jgi:hypothetical protein
MPTILYKWDFETGDTQGWTLESYVTLDSTGRLQGTYSLYTDSYRTGTINSGSSKRLAYIQNIDLSTATKPLLILLAKHYIGTSVGPYCAGITLVVKDSSGNILLQLSEKTVHYPAGATGLTITKVLVFDLSSVAGESYLTLELYWTAMDGNIYSYTGNWLVVDNIHIVDSGDKEYQIALMGLNGADRTLTYTIPDADKALPSGVAVYAVNLANPPHPLSESSDIFTYTATCDQGSASITSTDASNKHASPVTAPSTPPAYFNTLSARIYPTTAGTTWYSYDKTVVATFWDASWGLKAVYVFRVAITINPYSPAYASALINTTYGSAWSGQRDFTVKIHARSLSARIYVRFLVGDNTVVQSGTAKLEVYSSDYGTKYGESSVDLTTGTTLRGSIISDIPVDTTLVFRISWSITANARVVLEVRPELIVY